MKIFKIQSVHTAASFYAGLLVGMCLLSGCQLPPSITSDVSGIQISPLTGFVPGGTDDVNVKAVIEVLDEGGTPCARPCVFRFELYAFEPLSSDPRGKRLMIWPDCDLTSVSGENHYWKDYLKGYEFEFPLGFTPQIGVKYVLEVTCIRESFRLNDVKAIVYRP